MLLVHVSKSFVILLFPDGLAMVTVNELPPMTVQETYVTFSKLKESFGSEEFNFVLFYGNPTDTEISWGPDCRAIQFDFEICQRIQGSHKILHSSCRLTRRI